MSREFKYDVLQLIKGVRERPCIWDKTLENYKDRIERRTAWEEIFCTLDERYDEMTPAEKRITGEHILTKWTNVRDTFVKSLKTRLGKPKKKYLLYNHLKFLTRVSPQEEEYPLDISTDDVPVKFLKHELEPITRKRSKKSADYDDVYTPAKNTQSITKEVDCDANSYSDINFVECDELETSKLNDPRIMNEDEAFFASLLPTIVNYNEDERLEFRIEVLAVMKRIKQNRSWTDD